jgi:hypothetical protein
MLQLVSPAAPNPAPPSGKLAKYTMPALRPAASTILSQLLTRDEMTADKIVDLRDKFRDAVTGWLEIEEAA